MGSSSHNKSHGISRNQTGRETLASSIEAAVTMAIRWQGGGGEYRTERGSRVTAQDPAPPIYVQKAQPWPSSTHKYILSISGIVYWLGVFLILDFDFYPMCWWGSEEIY